MSNPLFVRFSYLIVEIGFFRGWRSFRLLAHFLRGTSIGNSLSPVQVIESRRTVIVFSMKIVAPDEKRTAILRTLNSLLGPTRAAPGCMQAQLYADLDDHRTLFLVEEWEARDQFERNIDATKLNTIVAAIELSSEAPVVRVDLVERKEGVQTLARRN